MKMNKRLPALAVLLVAFALIVAACGSSEETTTTAEDVGATTTTAAATTTTEEAMEEPEFGALGGVIVASGEDIQIRVSQTISGAVEST